MSSNKSWMVVVCFFVAASCSKEDRDVEKVGERVGKAATRLLRGVGKGVAQEGEKTGEVLGEGAAKLATGAGKGVAKEGEKLGEALGEGAVKVTAGGIKGAGKGLESVLLDVRVTKQLKGVKVTRAELVTDSTPKADRTMVVLVELPAGFKGKLKLSAVDTKGGELFSDTITAAAKKGEAAQRLEFQYGKGISPLDVRHFLDKGD